MEKEINLYKIIRSVITEVNCWKGYHKKGTKNFLVK